MPTFYVSPVDVSDLGEVRIAGADAHHLRTVLRARRGDLVTVVAEAGTELEVRLERLTPESIVGTVVTARRVGREPVPQLHIVQALPKGRGMDEICERLAELGAASIWPVVTARSVPRLEPTAATARVARWRAIVREAAQLAGRHHVPEVLDIAPAREALELLCARHTDPQILVCHRAAGGQTITSVAWDPGRATALLIGPEGGFGTEEIHHLTVMGATPVSLGPRNLRTVLSGLVATTVLLARSGEFDAPRQRSHSG